jgi:hypothetical protein
LGPCRLRLYTGHADDADDDDDDDDDEKGEGGGAAAAGGAVKFHESAIARPLPTANLRGALTVVVQYTPGSSAGTAKPGGGSAS